MLKTSEKRVHHFYSTPFNIAEFNMLNTFGHLAKRRRMMLLVLNGVETHLIAIISLVPGVNNNVNFFLSARATMLNTYIYKKH